MKIISMFSCVLVLTAFVVFGCNKFNLDKNIIHTYEACLDKEKCVINFNELFPFDWDYLFIFGIGSESDGVSDNIGFRYGYKDPSSRLILLIKGNNILFKQEEKSISKAYPIVFDTDSIRFTRENSIFRINKDENSYVLTHIPNFD